MRRLVNRFEKVGKLDGELFSDILDGLNSVQKVKMNERPVGIRKNESADGEVIGRLLIKSRTWRCQRREENLKRSLYSSIFRNGLITANQLDIFSSCVLYEHNMLHSSRGGE